jgi:hypothetical protein
MTVTGKVRENDLREPSTEALGLAGRRRGHRHEGVA